MVPSVKEARKRGVYQSVRPFESFTTQGVRWTNGQEEVVDTVIFCTGYRPALDHLRPLNVIEPDGKVQTQDTRAEKMAGLWLVGYGSWTGFASATLIGVGRSAKNSVAEVENYFTNVLSS